MSAGYVYLFRLGEFHKIGRAKDVERRAFSFTSLPFDFEIIHRFLSPDMVRDERRLHDRFSLHRVRGEWFRLSPGQVESFKAIKDDPAVQPPPLPSPATEAVRIRSDLMAMVRALAGSAGQTPCAFLDTLLRPLVDKEFDKFKAEQAKPKKAKPAPDAE